ncbi:MULTISPECIES: YdaS family helix-turn-helix protein [unclassified Acinetobacter]|uniref:YdaS family helix-turn-helix protein n=1 Tax=unclassified Acinetobacter TaxID=196816 RepID=UPI002448076F|nr:MULTISPECIES: YdaS family helix-turn-helix protein [unclassified Acinetobacter]MDH0032534.1 helix-turn-helix domain-containing protein [Acinetobacter sp. GD04021]MDH0885225.1 helix-turn-helix domain-containing protein [Acinetobacter sp. GD03873]MDH1084447.1 helix-turn-helix domain-containing protein [Acinetobacter sp. GD03983]MDH2188335.1 helix-turn-helix domain-containing protein [Acinetobacter sp. GD03645]MDH2203846.1 helix-turn-helix domain-containing protein [Acinetobacter sp. GD03647]
MTSIQKTEQAKTQVTSLLSYLKKLGSDDATEKFAKKCGTTKGNLLQIAYGGSVSARLSKKICNESNGEVPLEELRPDIFA